MAECPRLPDAWRPHHSEIFYCEGPLVQVDGEGLAFLKAVARQNPSGKARLCAHATPEDNLHEMLIVHAQHTYVRPHRHRGKGESFLILEGEADVVLFDEAGGITGRIPMAPFAPGRIGYYRLREPRFHTLRIRSACLVFLEVTEGPFDPARTEFAPWSPDPGDGPGVEAWVRQLDRELARVRG